MGMGRGADPLVLIHGAAGASWRDFAPLLPLLEAQREVVVLRTPGHYEASPLDADRDLTVESFVDVLEQELLERGLEAPDLVGDSTGGLFALELARRGRARAVVAISPAGMWTAEEARKVQRDVRRAYRLTRRMLPLAVALVRTSGGRYVFAPMLGTRGARLDGEEAAHIVRALADSTLTVDFMDANRTADGGLPTIERPSEIRCPVLILWGSQDKLLPVEQGQRWAEAVPGAEIEELMGVGHHPQYDQPEQVSELILEFFARRNQEAEAGRRA
jgi:pimeloyl-ACP methyl ester carboxylesterase